MYESPIELMIGKFYTQMQEKQEAAILEAIQEINVVVDKEELLKALEYDRGQYEKGYNDCLNRFSWFSADALPLDDEPVLVWFEYFRYGSYNRMFQTIGISSTCDDGERWSGFVNGQSGWEKLRIIAWQPLPDPPNMEGVKRE
jgi:8-oxo-dGTP pyrophosphatase MutT (NUDIX family)